MINEDLMGISVRSHLEDNASRGIVFGLDEKGRQVQLTWTSGRSANSKNRIYVVDGTTLRTEPADPSKVINPALILYNAMRSQSFIHVSSNGKHTDAVIEKSLKENAFTPQDFFHSLSSWFCEPDPVIFTPRITGYQDSRNIKEVYMSILKPEAFAKAHWENIQRQSGLKKEFYMKKDYTDAQVNEAYYDAIDRRAGLNHNEFPTTRHEYVLNVKPGIGYCLTTYKRGHEILDAFEGSPFMVPLRGSIDDIMNFFWNALEPEWRVSLGAKLIYDKNIIMAEPINKNKRVN